MGTAPSSSHQQQEEPDSPGKAPLTPCTRRCGVESAHAALRHPCWGGCAAQARRWHREKRRGLLARHRESMGSLSPTPRSAGCQRQPQHLGPPRARGRWQSPARQVPRIYVPRRALGNVPGAVPPHLPQHELMRSAGLGFTLALPPPVAAFRSHPEGRSLAALRHPAARLGPRLCLHPPPGSSLCTSWKCEGGCHCSRLHRTLPPAAHGAGPPPLSGPLQRSLTCTLGEQEHALTRWAACQGASPSSPGGSSKVPGLQTAPSPKAALAPPCQTGPWRRGCPLAACPVPSSPRWYCSTHSPPAVCVPPPPCAVSKHPPAMSSKHLGGSGQASKEQGDRLTFVICPPVWVCRAHTSLQAQPLPSSKNQKALHNQTLLGLPWLQQTFIRISEGGHGWLLCSGRKASEQRQPLQPAQVAFLKGHVALL